MSKKAGLDNVEKERRFKYPDVNQLYFDRSVHTAVVGDDLWGCTVCGKRGEEQIIAFRCEEDGSAPLVVEGPKGAVYKPVIVPGPKGPVVYWSECRGTEPGNERWVIRRAAVDKREERMSGPETVRECSGAVYALAAAEGRGLHYLAWTEIEEKTISLYAAGIPESGLLSQTLSQSGEDDLLLSRQGGLYFRPDIAAGEDGPVIACDTYRDGRYQVDLFSISGQAGPDGGGPVKVTLDREHEDWNHPKIVAAGGDYFLIWLATEDVVDERGIYERRSFLRGCTFSPGQATQCTFMTDLDNTEDSELIADLREGLLPREVSKGYVGLRRNPQLTAANGSVYLFWEVRKEADSTSIYGNLICRKVERDGSVGPSYCLHSGGYSYSVPKQTAGANPAGVEGLPAGFYLFEEEGFDILSNCYVTFDKKDTYKIDPADWRRWKHAELPGIEKERNTEDRDTITVGERTYTLYWGDTHCHSIMSPDAEGEVDELILYAREKAEVDVVSIIDNDFYPHKALTAAEWLIKQALSACFTVDDEFVSLPGYEYASHETGGGPEFNHRCVLYPDRGGKMFGRIHRGTETIEQAVARLKKEPGVIIYPHHCGYRLVDESVEKNVEVVSSWRVCVEETSFTWDLLKEGKKLGFIGSSDMHRQVPGLGGAITGILAEKLTPGSVAEAFQNRRLTATQGSFILIDFQVSGLFTGGTGTIDGPPEISARVRGPENIESVLLIRDGEIILTDTPGVQEHILRYTDTEAAAGNHWYCLKVKIEGDEGLNFPAPVPGQRGSLAPFTNNTRFPHNMARGRGPLAWASPIWLRIKG